MFDGITITLYCKKDFQLFKTKFLFGPDKCSYSTKCSYQTNATIVDDYIITNVKSLAPQGVSTSLILAHQIRHKNQFYHRLSELGRQNLPKKIQR